MITNDFHVHSAFSGDCFIPMSDMIEEAIRLKMTNLCFTEHHDLDFPNPVNSLILDFKAYQETFKKLRRQYADQINLLFGVEFGIQPDYHADLKSIAQEYPFDFIICSSHVVNGMDPYHKDYYFGKSKAVAYQEYFQCILDSVKNFSDYDVYGHLDYVIRYGPYEELHYQYKDFKGVLDEILKTLILNNKGIEVNTSGFKYELGTPHPTFEVINRYRELGGEIITIGSDAHRPSELCGYFNEVETLLKEAGFKYYTIFKNRKPEFIAL